MLEAVYNSAIPDVIPNTVMRNLFSAYVLRVARIFFVMLLLIAAAFAADWSGPEQQLARKIVAVTGPGAVSLIVENRSSLSRRESEIVQNGLRSVLEGVGLRFVRDDQAAATVSISLSENLSSYVWVAEIRQGAGEAAVVMAEMPRPEGSNTPRDSVPLTLRKVSIWAQDDPILDVAVLEENTVPSYIAVLDPGRVSLYRTLGGKWQQEQALEIVHPKPWPRDVRGRLIPARDHLLDVYLPGMICRSSAGLPLSLSCRESDDPWPLVAGASNGVVFPSTTQTAGTVGASFTIGPQMKAFFSPSRNFFTGALTPGVGKFTAVPKFYSAAWLPREKYTLWLFSATDGQVHMVDGVSDQIVKLGWGSDFSSVRTVCGAGWQVLASSPGDSGEDSVRAYEIPDRDAVAVSAGSP